MSTVLLGQVCQEQPTYFKLGWLSQDDVQRDEHALYYLASYVVMLRVHTGANCTYFDIHNTNSQDGQV